MILALKWINENIRNFNGDPDNITAMSASSSSSLIHVLMMTQAGKGEWIIAIIHSYLKIVPYILMFQWVYFRSIS